MSIDEKKTLGELLSDPRIRPIASDAITGMDLKQEGLWDKSIEQLREEQFGGGLTHGFDRLFAAADSGEWYYSLYSPEECAADPVKTGVSLVWFPSKDPAASTRPYILLVPGGGFVNVWVITFSFSPTASSGKSVCWIKTWKTLRRLSGSSGSMPRSSPSGGTGISPADSLPAAT